MNTRCVEFHSIIVFFLAASGFSTNAVDIPMIDKKDAPLKATFDLSVLNREIKAIIKEEVTREVERILNETCISELCNNDTVLPNTTSKICRHGWYKWKDTCFMISTETESWTNAKLICKALGGWLAEIHDAETNEFVKGHLTKYLNQQGKIYYIGLTDVANSGTWEWVHSRTLLTFADWGSSQPENNTEHCATLWPFDQFRWHDVVCSSHQLFICQDDTFSGLSNN